MQIAWSWPGGARWTPLPEEVTISRRIGKLSLLLPALKGLPEVPVETAVGRLLRPSATPVSEGGVEQRLGVGLQHPPAMLFKVQDPGGGHPRGHGRFPQSSTSLRI